MRKFFRSALAVAFLAASASASLAGSSDPGTIAGEVSANDSDVYREFFYEGESQISLRGYCQHGQDIDLWVYNSRGRELARSTGNSCYEEIWVDVRPGGETLRIQVENEGHPYSTSYSLTTD